MRGGGGKRGGVGGTQPCGRVLRLQVMRTTKTPASFIVPLPWGRTRVLAEPFLISPQRLAGLDGTRLRQMSKMERHKQCQKLGGSRNVDLRPPQGVTSQTLYIHNTTKLLQKEGRVGNKITVTVCFRAS